MVLEKWFTEKRFRLFSLLLFIFLFVYIILRAWLVDLLHDEAATFLHFIETGYIWHAKALLDANNHLLNSFAGKIIFKLFGENYFLLRLPNVLSFPIYFWSLYQLTKFVPRIPSRAFVLLSVSCIPFILDYFSSCRGYGISMAFFLAALVFLSRLVQNFTLKNQVLLSICLVIATYANLTFIVSCVLAATFVLLHQFIQGKKLSVQKHALHLLVQFLFTIAVLPAIYFSLKLKEGGALYYGRLDGLWEVTGKTLSRYVLFTDNDVLKWIYLLLGLTLIFLLIKRWFKLGFVHFFQDNNTFLAWFFFGHLFVIEVLARFMKVNYPEDRVGMYLIILSLLLVAGEMVKQKAPSWTYLPLLFFPIVFVLQINLSTSVFSPDDRMTKAFYQEIKKAIDNDKTSISVYNLMCLTWAIHDRNAETPRFPVNFDNASNNADIVLSRRNLEQPARFWQEFDTLYADPSNGFLLFKRKNIPEKFSVFDTTFSTPPSRNEFIGLRTIKIPDSLRGQKMQVHIKGTIITDEPRDEMTMTFSVFNKAGENTLYDGWTTRWSYGLKKEQQILFNYPMEKWMADDDEVRIYLFNRFKANVALKNVKFELLRLE
jgi:hypothetical protein